MPLLGLFYTILGLFYPILGLFYPKSIEKRGCCRAWYVSLTPVVGLLCPILGLFYPILGLLYPISGLFYPIGSRLLYGVKET